MPPWVVERVGDGGVSVAIAHAVGSEVTTFQPDYTCEYRVEDGVVRWQTVSGNTKQRGSARFRDLGGRTEIAYTETVGVEIGVPRIMAPALRPVV